MWVSSRLLIRYLETALSRPTFNYSLSTIDWQFIVEFLLLAMSAPLLLFPKHCLPWFGVGLITIGWLIRWRNSGRLLHSTGLELPALLLLVFAGIGYVVSLDRTLSEPRFWSLVLGLMFFISFSQGLRTPRQLHAVMLGVALLTLVVACLSLLGADWHSDRLINLFGWYDKLPAYRVGLPNSGLPGTSELFNPRAVGMTMGLIAPLLAALALFDRHPSESYSMRSLRDGERWLFSLSAVAAVGLLLLSQSLQALTGLFLGLWLLLLWRTRWAWLVLLFGALAVAMTLVVFNPLHLVPILFSIDNPVGIAIALRLDIWSRALAMIKEMPFTGIGLNIFPLVQSQFFPGFQLGIEPHAHNLYLQTALDMGVPGLLALIWLLVLWFIHIGRRLREACQPLERAIRIGLIASVSSYLFCGLFDALVIGSKSGVILWLLFGLGFAPASTPALLTIEQPGHMLLRSSKPSTSPSLRLTGLGLSALVLLVALWIFPGKVVTNYGMLMAQRVLYDLQSGNAITVEELDAARRALKSSLAYFPEDIYAWDLLGQLNAWLGEQTSAMAAFTNRVRLDGHQPLARYAPADALIQGSLSHREPDPNWDGLLRVYSKWQIRYPLHAENWLRSSLIYELYLNDPDRSEALLNQGLSAGAQPAELLRSKLESRQDHH